MRYLSTFSGVGGFDLGFDRAGMTCVDQVEIDKKARAVLDRHWPDVPKHDDITTAKEWASDIGLVGSVDLVCGGAPCQDLSIAGKRAGFGGERSVLVLDMVALAAHVEARWIVYENVPGLLSSNQGRDLGVLLTVLADSGFQYVEWRTLDSQHFGVPQRRRRVFLTAGVAAPRRAPLLLEREGSAGDHPAGGAAWAQSADSTDGGFAGRGVVAALTRNGLGGGGPDDNLAQAGHLISQPHSTPAATTEASAPSRESTSSSAEAYQCHGSNVGPMGALRKGDGGATSGVPFVAIEREREHRASPAAARCSRWRPR
jgi:DNA (cytosine-5)-methyltransferase 1